MAIYINAESQSAVCDDLSTIETKVDTVDGLHDAPAQNSTDNSLIRDVVGNKTDNATNIPGSGSLYDIAAFMGYYHVHAPSLCYPSDASPVQIVAGAGAWTEGTAQQIIAANAVTKIFDIHHVILGDISANDDYVIKIYYGATDIFWGEAAFTRDTNQVRGSQVPIQGRPVPANSRIKASLLSGSGSNNVEIKLYVHTYGYGETCPHI